MMGKKGLEEAKDIQSIRYIAPIKPGSHIEGYYRVTQARLQRIDDAAYPVRIVFDVKDWVKLKTPAKYGLVKFAYRGHCKTRAKFFKHCEDYPAIGKLEYLISKERDTSIPARPFAQQQPGVVPVQ